MDKKNSVTPLLVCIVLFVLAAAVSMLVSRDDTQTWEHGEGGSVVLSEIMSSNRTYPAPDGQYLDFVEVRNLSAGAVDISGYMISDDLSSIGYTFPEGTILPGYGYMVCWCNKESDSKDYAAFGISRRGGETIYLYNSANVLIDKVKLEFMDTNTSLVREDEDTWNVASPATPGYENSDVGYQDYLKDMDPKDSNVRISEIVTDNTCIVGPNMEIPCDYIEIVNLGKKDAVLDQVFLSNDPGDPLKWQIPAMTLEAGERIVICCKSDGDGIGSAPFGLAKSGCTVILTGSYGNVLSEVKCPAIPSDYSLSIRQDGSYQLTEYATPGFENTQKGYAQWMNAMRVEQPEVVIGEIMTSNRSTILSSSGRLCDWVELVNVGNATAVLDGYYLSDDASQRGKWRIPSLTLEPGERKVIRCVGSDASTDESTFGLSKSGTSVLLVGTYGNIISQVECPRMEDDRSWALQADGTYAETDMPTPGYSNDEAGYLQFRGSQNVVGPLAISEVVPSNDQYLIQADGKYYDWVELVNVANYDIDLSNYWISDNADELMMFRLPQRTLKAGERIVIICSANQKLAGGYIHAPFSLSSEECWIYVSDQSGKLCDYIRAVDVPRQGSVGRMNGRNGVFYFEYATPGNPNGAGVALVSAKPVVLTAEGIYADVKKLNVEIDGTGELHYTLDGSIPTKDDPIYDKSLTLKETAVLRVVSFEKNKMPSDVVTACYILNKEHALPVVTLSFEPDDLFGKDGIYENNQYDAEKSVNLKMFDGESMFSIDCGVELTGNPRKNYPKKSLKLNFRGRYGADVLGYPIYGNDRAQVFDSLILDAGSDDRQTMFRDELFSRIAGTYSDQVLTQRSEFCVLYMNGEYWGIYSLKESLGEVYYAQNTGAPMSFVKEVREPAGSHTEIGQLVRFCTQNDMTSSQNYDQIASMVDIDGLIDWMVLQGYSCNSSIGENQRYYQNGAGECKWQLPFADLDKAFYYRDGFEHVFATNSPWSYSEITSSLIINETFRNQFLLRVQQGMNGALSDEQVFEDIVYFQELLRPEMERELSRWGGQLEVWEADVNRLKAFVTRYDHWAMLEQSLRTSIALTDAEAATYFGR